MKNRIPNEGRKIKSASIFSRYNVYNAFSVEERQAARAIVALNLRMRSAGSRLAHTARRCSGAANEPTQTLHNLIELLLILRNNDLDM